MSRTVISQAADSRAAVARVLEEQLIVRHAALGATERTRVPRPAVATLGAANVEVPGSDASVRSRRDATVHLGPSMVVLGPFTEAATGARPCGYCLALRWQRLRAQFERQALELGSGMRSTGDWPLLPPGLVDAAWHLYLAAAGHSGDAGGAMGDAWVWVIDSESLFVRRLPLVADPLCPGCAELLAEPCTAELPPAPKRAEDDYRARSVHSFELPDASFVNPVCGILGRAAFLSITSPTTAPVNGRVVFKGHQRLAELTWSGQGNSYQASRRLAYLEGLERYAGVARRHRAEPIVAAYQDIADRALDPRGCGAYGERTYDLDPYVTPFDPAKPIPWVRGVRLDSGEPVLVPSRLVYYGGGTTDDNFVYDSSNGCASGSSLPEAILFGLLELIERDSFLLGWYGGAQLTEIDTDQLPDPELRMMLDRAELQGYDVHLFDNRIDLAVPAVTGVAVRRDGGPGSLAFAAGASLDPRAAMLGAMAEILTYLPALPVRLRERTDDVRAMMDDYFLVRQLTDHPTLFALPEMAPLAERYRSPVRSLSFAEVYRDWDSARPRNCDLRADVGLVVGELAEAGLDVIVVEQTSPEQRALGVHTVKTIVPGLLPIDFGWSRQRALQMPRMFTAYRQAGWREDDLTPSDLHAVPHPFP